MRARQFVEDLAAQYGLEVVKSWDSDMDIMLPEGQLPAGLGSELRKHGFKYSYYPEDNPTEIHIHAPHRKEKSWSDRGWDWEVEGTKQELPGEQPYYGEDYLRGPGEKFSQN